MRADLTAGGNFNLFYFDLKVRCNKIVVPCMPANAKSTPRALSNFFFKCFLFSSC
eukprot:NODE_1793_length_490_cov_130.099773_g1715_i0.p2 GENE.NODE_1793_length_490_cov_130.099773_g1715_i0~~NODE_1793_length_490_cov_130.099773_g1715_i0.p2  ORF type:complete len:55 (+),score=6.14 NODE_1793_length_490_cov_130.099773_g1715_i0:126-290(+)